MNASDWLPIWNEKYRTCATGQDINGLTAWVNRNGKTFNVQLKKYSGEVVLESESPDFPFSLAECRFTSDARKLVLEYFPGIISLDGEPTEWFSLKGQIPVEVDFSKKDIVKKLGCRWVANCKTWAAPDFETYQKATLAIGGTQ